MSFIISWFSRSDSWLTVFWLSWCRGRSAYALGWSIWEMSCKIPPIGPPVCVSSTAQRSPCITPHTTSPSAAAGPVVVVFLFFFSFFFMWSCKRLWQCIILILFLPHFTPLNLKVEDSTRIKLSDISVKKNKKTKTTQCRACGMGKCGQIWKCLCLFVFMKQKKKILSNQYLAFCWEMMQLKRVWSNLRILSYHVILWDLRCVCAQIMCWRWL